MINRLRVKRQTAVLVLIFLAVAFTGCADLSPKGDYLAARIWFNDQANDLADYRDTLSAEEQAKMNEVVKPVLASGKVALAAWGLAITEGKDPVAQINSWRVVLKQVTNLVTLYLGD